MRMQCQLSFVFDIQLAVYLPACLSIYSYFWRCPSAFLSAYLSVCLFIHRLVCLPACHAGVCFAAITQITVEWMKCTCWLPCFKICS